MATLHLRPVNLLRFLQELKLVVLSCVLVSAWAAAVFRDSSLRELPALRHEEIHDDYGQYALRYVTAEDTVVSERGRLVPGDHGGYVLAIEGRYQYIGDDGKVYITSYSGGPGGFKVDSNHLPKPARV